MLQELSYGKIGLLFIFIFLKEREDDLRIVDEIIWVKNHKSSPTRQVMLKLRTWGWVDMTFFGLIVEQGTFKHFASKGMCVDFV